ncbi:probable tryptophanyl-tRNA synthetase, mitochondrial [Serendipita indica DSM 11827]|uniref:tryptophan--tRNA ligase n=1 Tax=Serendipita indica (strain DSM 11827) TaxID=1109443 RepID=G4TCK4_SERID|nr:probable tryptophanyl-tRNA synthetase, mitochondrial [Serendipita indica DSM 11827]
MLQPRARLRGLTQRLCLSSSTTRRCLSSVVDHPRVVFSGIQPTGVPHLGNYFGALSQWVEMQNSPEPQTLLYSVVGLHALTMPQDAKKLREDRLNTLASILAVGVDPKKAVLFFQEDVPHHAELAWLLNCMVNIGRLKRMTTWKSKLQIQQNLDVDTEVDESGLNLGLFTYPVLQAADVLLYRTTHVPVGEDQRQHLELARELAQKVNRVMKTDFFPLPMAVTNPAKRILALRGSPPKKMSKSAPDERSRIMITDSSEYIQHKIKTAVTDSVDPEAIADESVPNLADLSPGVANLYTIMSCCTGEDTSDIIPRYYRQRYGRLKADVAEAINAKIAPIRAEFERLKRPENAGYLTQVAAEGRERASEIAEKNLSQIKALLGIQRI